MTVDYLKNNNIYITKVNEEILYPKNSPYNPSINYPEYTLNEISNEKNVVYDSIRNLLYLMNLDYKNFNTPNWNPFSEFISPNQTVLLKPNWVVHYNHIIHYGLPNDMDCTITHGSVIRVIMDYVALALNGQGKIVILDCPIQGTDWNKLLNVIGWNKIQQLYKTKYPNLKLEIIDGRLGKAYYIGETMIKRVVDESRLSDYYEVDIGSESLLVPLMNDAYEFGVSQYPKYRMKKAHTPTVNKYLIPKIVLEADCVINIPKLKSHMKSGITCALKNFVGINGHKDYLPHFRFKSPKDGGDEYPDGDLIWDLMWYFEHKDWELDKGIRKIIYHNLFRLLAFIQVFFMKKPRGFTRVGAGSWYGNDTLWRTILDINRCFFYYDVKNMKMNNNVQRKYFCIVDGLVGGHKESPLAPSRVDSGFFILGFNPVYIDTVCSYLMGFDYKKIKVVNNAYLNYKYPLSFSKPDDLKINLLYNKNIYNITLNEVKKYRVNFEPSSGFKGFIELID